MRYYRVSYKMYADNYSYKISLGIYLCVYLEL